MDDADTRDPGPDDRAPEGSPDTGDAGLDDNRGPDGSLDTRDAGPDDPIADDSMTGDQDQPESLITDDQVRDELPEDLDAASYVGPYLFPNNNRRRIPGYLYIAIAIACLLAWFMTRGDEPVLVNDGMLFAAALLGGFGIYSIAAGRNLDVDERDALVAATRTVGFPVGHASAQLGWRGLLSVPTWRILLYSNENPPTKRGLVLVDGCDGEVLEWFVEDNPEDWTDFTP